MSQTLYNKQELKGLKHIILGFDFDFNPVCLLVDASIDDPGFNAEQKDYLDWSNFFPDDFNWYKIEEGDQVFRRKDHDGIWALRAHRLHGLNVVLSESTRTFPVLLQRPCRRDLENVGWIGTTFRLRLGSRRHVKTISKKELLSLMRCTIHSSHFRRRTSIWAHGGCNEI